MALLSADRDWVVRQMLQAERSVRRDLTDLEDRVVVLEGHLIVPPIQPQQFMDAWQTVLDEFPCPCGQQVSLSPWDPRWHHKPECPWFHRPNQVP